MAARAFLIFYCFSHLSARCATLRLIRRSQRLCSLHGTSLGILAGNKRPRQLYRPKPLSKFVPSLSQLNCG